MESQSDGSDNIHYISPYLTLPIRTEAEAREDIRCGGLFRNHAYWEGRAKVRDQMADESSGPTKDYHIAIAEELRRHYDRTMK